MNTPVLITSVVAVVLGAAIGVAGFTGVIDFSFVMNESAETEIETGDTDSELDDEEREKLEYIEKIERFLADHPNDRKARLKYGATLVEMEEFERAEEFYKSELESNSDDADLLYGLGWVYEKSQQWEQAISFYEQATQSNKRQVGAWNNLAWVLATCPEDEFRDGDRALKLANKAMELAGGEALFVADTLAAALAETGDYEAASELQRQVVIRADEEDKPELRKRLIAYQHREAFRSE